MSFLSDLLRKITGGSSGGGLRPQSELTTDEGQALWIYLECANCGEHIASPAENQRNPAERWARKR